MMAVTVSWRQEEERSDPSTNFFSRDGIDYSDDTYTQITNHNNIPHC
jgi:hypothetical protein